MTARLYWAPLGTPPPGSCPTCLHPTAEHSREDGVGCLHTIEGTWHGICPCPEPGTSEADQ